MEPNFALVFAATAWGSKHGGINALNSDLALHIAKYGGKKVKVSCLVPQSDPDDFIAAKKMGVRLVQVPALDRDPLGAAAWLASQPEDVAALSADETFVVGHDVFTGEFACALARSMRNWRSCVFVHMDYAAYDSLRGQPRATTIKDDKSRAQGRVIEMADVVASVGPKLFHAANRLGARSATLYQFVPGLGAQPRTLELVRDRAFHAFISGRLDPWNDVVKQGILAVAGFARAIKLIEQANQRESVRDAVLNVFGVDLEDGPPPNQAFTLRAVAETLAERVISINAHPFTTDRQAMHSVLSAQHASLFTSLHDGFGLSGWEAVENTVPLVLTKNCGLSMLLESHNLEHLAKSIDIRFGLDYQKLAASTTNNSRHASLMNLKNAEADRYIKALYEPDVNLVAEALKDIWLNYEVATANSVELRSQLLSAGYSWQVVVDKFLNWLRASRRTQQQDLFHVASSKSADDQSSGDPANPTATSPAHSYLAETQRSQPKLDEAEAKPLDVFEEALRDMSNEFVDRYIHNSVASDLNALDQLDGAFSKLVKLRGADLDFPARQVVATLLSPSSRRGIVHFSAYSGSGREQFIALVYLMLKAASDNRNDIFPVVLDRQQETRPGWSIDSRVTEYLRRHDIAATGKRYIVLIVGNRHWPAKLREEPARNLSRLNEWLTKNCTSILVISGRSKRANADLANAETGRMYEIVGQSLDDEAMRGVLSIAASADGVDLNQALFEAASVALRRMCRQHRCEPDVFVARQVLLSITSNGPQHDSLGSLVTGFVDTFVRRLLAANGGQDVGTEAGAAAVSMTVRQLASTHYSVFASQSAKKLKAREPRQTSLGENMGGGNDIESGLLELIRTHRTIRDWLVATEVFYSFVDYGAIHRRSESRAESISARLDHVFPSRITAFLRDYLEHGPSEDLSDALAAVSSHLLDSSGMPNRSQPQRRRPAGVNIRNRKFMTTCAYIAGRAKGLTTRAEMKRDLEQVGRSVAYDIDDFRRVRLLVTQAAEANAPAIRRWAKALFGLFGIEMQVQDHQISALLERTERELLLLQRGIFISRAMLGDTDAAETYVSQLMNHYAHDDLNRGFHREYYGDLDFSPTEPLLSDDKSLTICRRTLSALMTELPTLPANAPMAQIQLYTIASLARPRNVRAAMPTSELVDVRHFLANEVLRHPGILGALKDFLEATISEIDCGKYALEAYIDDLYEIKFQKRAGWKKSAPSESVAAHLYMTERLVELFVSKADVLVSKTRVMELVRTHDIGEAIASDFRDRDKGSVEEARESSAVRRIANIGVLTESDEFMQLADNYQRFESVKNLPPTLVTAETFANDIDRLDLLIQFYRYLRENGKVEDELDFRKSISLDRFRTSPIRDCASRFTEYFSSDLAVRSQDKRIETRLWPKDVPRICRIDAV